MNHVTLAVVILTVMVLSLFALGFALLSAIKATELRIRYLEGTIDMVLESQEHLNKVMIACMENSRF